MTMKMVATIAAVAAVDALLAANMREVSFMSAMPVEKAPVLDGSLDDPCWKKGVKNTAFYEYLRPNPKQVPVRTTCTIVYDREGVYCAMENLDDNPKLVKRMSLKNGLMSIHKDDCNEVHFDPDAKGIGFYRWAVNANGKYKASWRMDSANFREDWNGPGVKAAAKLVADGWTAELFVPWSAFHGRTMPAPGTVWTVNINRYRYGEGRSLFCSSAPGASYLTPGNFGYLYFSGGETPDAEKVVEIVRKRVKPVWAIQIGTKTYMCDLKGVRESSETIQQYVARAAEEQKKEDDLHRTNLVRLAEADFKAPPVKLELAGCYDLNPPKEYDGFNGWYRHNFIKDAYETPHLDWEPKAASRTRVLFFTDAGFYNGTSRDAIEFTQRFDVEPLWYPCNFGAIGPYEDPLSLGGPFDKACQLETLLAKDPDVFVWYGIGGTIPRKYLYEILRRVRDGGKGLVLVGWCGEIGSWARKAKPNRAARIELARRAAVASIPNIRAAGASPYRCERGLSADQTAIDARDFGKGRIVALDWMRPPWSLTWKGSYESRFPAMRNAIDWAAGVTHKCDIRFAADAASEDLPADANFIAFEAAAPDGATVKVRVRNAWNDIVLRREWRVAPGKTMLSIPVGDLPGGGYHTDVIAETRGSNAAVYQHPFTKAGVALTIAGTNETIVAENRAASLPVSWNRNLPFDCELRAELRDRPYGQVRRVWRQPAPKNRTWVAVGIPGEPFPTLSGEIIARLVSTNDNRLVAEERKLVYFPNSRQDIYPSISWDTAGSGGMPELFAPQLVEKFGYRNNLGGSQGKQCAWFNARNVPYSCRVGIWAAKGGCNWPQIPVPAGKKRNEVLEELGYDCSPYNPAARKAIEEGYTPVVKHSAPYGVCVWSFGDECGYGNDLGIGSKTDARDYGAFLKAKYGTLERYNRAHGTSIDSFEKAEHATVKDAIDRRDWPLWFDNVQYSEKMYADMYEFLQSIVKKYDPKGRCGAEGSVPGDLELTVKNLKFWGPYRSLVNDEVLRNIAPDHVRAIWWGGYLARSLRDGYPVQQWEFLVTGTVNADEWYTITPGGTESAFGGDYDLAPYAKQYLPHLSKLRRGQAQVLVRTPMRQSPFALYYSHPSVRAASVEDAVISPEGGLADLIRFAYRYGYDTRMITPRTIKKLDGGVKVLFLAGSNALSDEEISVFKAFVKRGGVLVADSVPGVFDQFLAKRVSPPLEGAYEKFENFRDAAKLAELLARNKIAPVESVSGLPADAVILRVREVGGMKVVGLKTHTMHRMNAVTLDFGGESHVYEVDEGPVGKVRKVEMKPMGVPFRLFSVFTEEQKPPAFAFEGGRDSIAPGDFLEYGTGKLRKGSIYRLEVLDPDMKPIDCREEIFAADARPRRLQFPFSDRPGSYTVVLRDIATGLDAAVQVKVNPAVCSVAEGGAK